jgi:multiple sugar transport system substrate-binding protein
MLLTSFNLRRLIVIFLIFFLTGCNRNTKELIFSVGGAPNELDFWEKVVSNFEKEKGIKVIILRQPADSDQRRQGILVPLKAKVPNPDVFLMDIAWIAQFAASGWLEDLNKFIKKEKYDLGNFWQNVINSADTYNGKLVALPVYIDAGVLYYRKDILEKYGVKKVPTNWDDFINISIKIQSEERKKNNKFYAFVWQGAQYEGLICNFLEFASSKGGILLSGERLVVNTEYNLKAVNLMRDLIHRYKISPPNTYTDMKEEEVRLYFQSGNALFERNWPYAYRLHQAEESPVKDRVGITTLPAFKGSSSVSTLGGWHIGMSVYSDMKKEAWEFIKYVVSFKIQKDLSLHLGWNPARKDVYVDKEVLKKYPHFKELAKVFSTARARPKLPYYTQVSSILQRYINLAIADKISAEEALSKAEKEINTLIERYK